MEKEKQNQVGTLVLVLNYVS